MRRDGKSHGLQAVELANRRKRALAPGSFSGPVLPGLPQKTRPFFIDTVPWNLSAENNVKIRLLASLSLFLCALPFAAAQSTPNIAGQVNGAFPEPNPLNFEDHTGFVSLFDGRTLQGWDGQPGIWSVEDGAIVGVSTPEHRAGNTFLVLRNVTANDFDLKLEIKVEQGGGSGIQYRSSTGIPPGRTAGKGEPPLDPRWVMIGPQADFWLATNDSNK